MLQEALKRLPRQVLRRCRDSEPFGSRFCPEKEALGLKKTRNSVRRHQNYVVSPFGARIACGTRFGTLPGSVLGAFWPSRWLKPLLKFLWGRPRAVQEHCFSRLEPSKSSPRGIQEHSQRHTRALEEASESSRGSKMPPRGFGDRF